MDAFTLFRPAADAPTTWFGAGVYADFNDTHARGWCSVVNGVLHLNDLPIVPSPGCMRITREDYLQPKHAKTLFVHLPLPPAGSARLATAYTVEDQLLALLPSDAAALAKKDQLRALLLFDVPAIAQTDADPTAAYEVSVRGVCIYAGRAWGRAEMAPLTLVRRAAKSVASLTDEHDNSGFVWVREPADRRLPHVSGTFASAATRIQSRLKGSDAYAALAALNGRSVPRTSGLDAYNHTRLREFFGNEQARIHQLDEEAPVAVSA